MRRIPFIRVLSVGIAVAILAPPGPAYGWHATGHMISAQIAHDALDAETRAEVDRLVAVLAEHSPRDQAATAALWADDLKREGVEAFDRWHYINQPYADRFTGSLPAPAMDNVVWAIEQASATLRSEAGDLAKAWMLRFLLHAVGDIHQPLHCVSRFSPGHPEGDRGGNDFLLSGKHAQLHSYWDKGADLFPVFDGKDWPAHGRRLTDETTRAVPRSAVPEWRLSDPRGWADESYRLAVEGVYDGIEEFSQPSAEYEARAQRVVQRQLALAGYRLAALLEEVLGGAEDKP